METPDTMKVIDSYTACGLEFIRVQCECGNIVTNRVSQDTVRCFVCERRQGTGDLDRVQRPSDRI